MNIRMVSQSIAAIMLLSAMAALAVPPPGFRWTQTFGDDFDGTAVDLKKWKPQFFGCHVINGELQAYQPGNVSVSDGKLCLVARREQCSYAYCGQPGIVKDYSSGCAVSEGKFAQKYGYWEGRFVFPRVRGTWPAFWLLPQNESGQMAGWPPEVDIFDAVDLGDGPLMDLPWGIYCGSNYPNPGGNVYLCTGNRAPLSSDMSVNYHTAGFLWTPDSAAFYVDDVRVRNKSGQTEAAYRGGTQWTYPMYMLVNMALNPNVGATYANLPCTTKVDWVRVYAQAPLPADNTPPTLAPSGFTAQVLGDTKIRLSWERLADAADPETGIKSYALYQNGVKIIDTRDTVDTVTGLTEQTQYTFAVAALNWRDLEGPRASVTATTLADVAPPTILQAGSGSANTSVYVIFSEPVEQSSAQSVGNYGISGGISVTAALLQSDLKTVVLTTSALTKGITYTLTVNNIRDRAKSPNTIAAGASATFYCVAGITQIRYYPRQGYGVRMTGGVFEATNGDKDAGPYTTIYTIAAQPPEGQWTAATSLSNADQGFRYIRYRAPANSYGNVAEIEFYRGAFKVTGPLFGTAGSYENSGNDYTKAFDGNTATYWDFSQADGAYAGMDISESATVGPGAIAAAPANMRAAALLLGNTLVIPAGAYSLEILDVAGKLVAGESGRGPASRDLTFVKPGAYVLQLCGKGRPTARWIFVRK
jgi:beta-glucanase (GH16 family)